MHSRDAVARNITDGDVVRVYNDRGQILAGAVITEAIMPGVIQIQEGGWFDPLDPREIGSLCRYGDVNNLTPGIATSKLAQAEKFTDDLPDVTVFSQPESTSNPKASG